MTVETYKAIKPYLSKLELAERANYVRMTRTDIVAMNPLFKDAIGRELTRSQAGCSTCVVKALKDLYKAYVAFSKLPAGRKADKEDGEEHC